VVAVIGVIAGVSATAGRPAGNSSGTPAGMPPYYVILAGAYHRHSAALTAAVRDSATGAVLTTVHVPVHGQYYRGIPGPSVYIPGQSTISGGADGHTFLITDDLGLFLLKVAADGHSARLTRVPFQVPNHYAIALSPDGRQLALELSNCSPRRQPGACSFDVEVISLATGASKMWNGGPVSYLLEPELSWASDSANILFWWTGEGKPAPDGVCLIGTCQGYRLLNVTSPAGSVLGSSRPVATPAGYEFLLAGVTLTGRTLVFAGSRDVVGPDNRNTEAAQVVEVSASTGRPLRVLYKPARADDSCEVDALGPVGLNVLVQCPGLGRLSGNGQFTPLPGLQTPMDSNGVGELADW
jgi:hypothetical protein